MENLINNPSSPSEQSRRILYCVREHGVEAEQHRGEVVGGYNKGDRKGCGAGAVVTLSALHIYLKILKLKNGEGILLHECD